MYLETVISKVNSYISNCIENANLGGCGWIAYYIYKECIKHNINFTIKLYDAHYYTRGLVWVGSGRYSYITAGHVWLNLEGIDINYDYDECFTEITEKEEIDKTMKLIRRSLLIRRRSLWNESYDKSQNDKLRKAIQYYFNQLE